MFGKREPERETHKTEKKNQKDNKWPSLTRIRRSNYGWSFLWLALNTARFFLQFRSNSNNKGKLAYL